MSGIKVNSCGTIAFIEIGCLSLNLTIAKLPSQLSTRLNHFFSCLLIEKDVFNCYVFKSQ